MEPEGSVFDWSAHSDRRHDAAVAPDAPALGRFDPLKAPYPKWGKTGSRCTGRVRMPCLQVEVLDLLAGALTAPGSTWTRKTKVYCCARCGPLAPVRTGNMLPRFALAELGHLAGHEAVCLTAPWPAREPAAAVVPEKLC